MHQENHVDDTGWKYCQLSSVDIAEIQQYFQPPSRIFIMPEMLQMKYHSVDDITVFNSVQSWGDVYKTQVSFNIHFIVYNLALIAELRVVEFSSP